MAFKSPLPDGLTLAPNAPGDANNPAASNQELQAHRSWGRWATVLDLPNGPNNPATGFAYSAMRPGDEAFVQGVGLYCLSDRGTANGGDAAWMPPVPPSIEERWYGAETSTNDSEFRVRSVGSTGSFRFNFQVPGSFAALTSLELIGWPSAGAAGVNKDIDLFSSYGAVGESRSAHTETDAGTVYDLGTVDVILGLDLSPVFSQLAAGDFCGVQVDHNGIGGAVSYIGIRLRFTR